MKLSNVIWHLMVSLVVILVVADVVVLLRNGELIFPPAAVTFRRPLRTAAASGDNRSELLGIVVLLDVETWQTNRQAKVIATGWKNLIVVAWNKNDSSRLCSL